MGINWLSYIDEMEREIKKLKLVMQKIENELSYLIEMEKLGNQLIRPSGNKDFNKYWIELVNRNFDPNVLRHQLNTLNKEDRKEYIDYSVEQYGNYTIEEWLNEYEIIDKSEQFVKLDKQRLDPEQEYKVRASIDKADYRDSTIGKWTRENLELFRTKYYDPTRKSKNEHLKIKEHILGSNQTDSESKQGKQKNDRRDQRMKPFFDDTIIFGQLDKLEDNKKLDFINSTLLAVDQFFGGRDFYQLPFHIRLLVRQLEGQKLIYENFKSSMSIVKIETEKISNESGTNSMVINDDKVLRSFGRDELQKALEPYAKEYDFQTGDTVESKKVQLITRKLREAGWDAKETSVAEAFRKMGYVKGRRK